MQLRRLRALVSGAKHPSCNCWQALYTGTCQTCKSSHTALRRSRASPATRPTCPAQPRQPQQTKQQHSRYTSRSSGTVASWSRRALAPFETGRAPTPPEWQYEQCPRVEFSIGPAWSDTNGRHASWRRMVPGGKAKLGREPQRRVAGWQVLLVQEQGLCVEALRRLLILLSLGGQKLLDFD